MDTSKILSSLFVGSCPQSQYDVSHLKLLGISHVVSLQTDDDLVDYEIDWVFMQSAYSDSGIGITRLPITDFAPEELQGKLYAIVDVLDGLIQHNTVYLHCNAGINRSPTVAIAYMIRKLGMPKERAVREFLNKRISAPYTEILPDE